LLAQRREFTAHLGGDMITQPDQQLLGIRDRGLTDAEACPDLGTQTLGRPPGEDDVVRRWRRDVQLAAEGGEPLRLDLAGVPWEPAPLAEKGQQDSPTGSPDAWSSPASARPVSTSTDRRFARNPSPG
jgi:hypothetical protein